MHAENKREASQQPVIETFRSLIEHGRQSGESTSVSSHKDKHYLTLVLILFVSDLTDRDHAGLCPAHIHPLRDEKG